MLSNETNVEHAKMENQTSSRFICIAEGRENILSHRATLVFAAASHACPIAVSSST